MSENALVSPEPDGGARVDARAEINVTEEAKKLENGESKEAKS